MDKHFPHIFTKENPLQRLFNDIVRFDLRATLGLTARGRSWSEMKLITRYINGGAT